MPVWTESLRLSRLTVFGPEYVIFMMVRTT